jgi:SAM-dependent methyltransferase
MQPMRIRRVAAKAVFGPSFALSHWAERHDVERLIYNPGVHLYYHYTALINAPNTIGAIAAEIPTARSWLDVGCGTGMFARAVRARGGSVSACEHSPLARGIGRLYGIDIAPLDLMRDPPADVAGPFDLAYSFEVAEHLPPHLGDRLVALLARSAPVIVFSAAHPGQYGQGHVNEQEKPYWIERFGRHGYRHDAECSLRVVERITDPKGLGWFIRHNLMVLRRDAPA